MRHRAWEGCVCLQNYRALHSSTMCLILCQTGQQEHFFPLLPTATPKTFPLLYTSQVLSTHELFPVLSSSLIQVKNKILPSSSGSSFSIIHGTGLVSTHPRSVPWKDWHFCWSPPGSQANLKVGHRPTDELTWPPRSALQPLVVRRPQL